MWPAIPSSSNISPAQPTAPEPAIPAPLSKRQQRKLKGEQWAKEHDGETKPREPKSADPESEARRKAEQTAKKEAAAKLRAEKKAEANEIRKAKQAELAAQKKKEQEERKAAEAAAAEAAAEKLAFELAPPSSREIAATWRTAAS